MIGANMWWIMLMYEYDPKLFDEPGVQFIPWVVLISIIIFFYCILRKKDMIRLWYVEEPKIYTHENGCSLGIFKYESSAKIYLEKLNKIPGNDKRTFVINHYDEPISSFPEWSWVWNTSEEEENKKIRGE